jgi:chromosome segregation ATPase
MTPQDLAAHVQRGREYIERSRVDRRALPADETTRLVNRLTEDRDRWKHECADLTRRAGTAEADLEIAREHIASLTREMAHANQHIGALLRERHRRERGAA